MIKLKAQFLWIKYLKKYGGVTGTILGVFFLSSPGLVHSIQPIAANSSKTLGDPQRATQVLEAAMDHKDQLIKGQPIQHQAARHEGVSYTPPPDAGTPEPTGGTGSRGGCVYLPDRPPLVALVGQPHLMLTTSDRPVFWIYVPYSPEQAPSGFFSLQQGDEAIYEATFSLDATPGVVGLQLPDSAPSLVANQEYTWFIDINCVAAVEDGTAIDDTPGSLYGLVERVEVSDQLAQDLDQAQTGLDVVATYGKHHIWYDWITTLADLRLEAIAYPELNAPELETVWQNVLADEQAVWLTPWANEPLSGEIGLTDWRENYAELQPE